ncbi:DGQHR domain-containing protein [Gammaproteobacteria bacterium]|nr:DGQHR domain-containing protein [Gammaproteobacteria bacterium]
MKKPFENIFYDNSTIEGLSLIDAADSERIKELRKLKKHDLRDLKEKKVKNAHGYEFELDTWEFFLSLKPSYINNITKNFKFDLSEYRNLSGVIDKKDRAYQSTKQTDIVAIYDKYVFVVECKSSMTKKIKSSESLSDEIELFKSLNQHKTKRIHKIFGEEYIPVYIVCTQGYLLDSRDQIDSLKENNIILFSEKYKEYIEAVLDSSQSPEFALIQFLGFFRAGQPDFNIVSSEGNQKEKTPWKLQSFSSSSGVGKKNNVFTFSISPNDMLKIATVSHQKAKVIFETHSTSPKHYQRLLQKGRLAKIGKHLEEKNTPFPNNILVSYRGKKELFFKPVKNTKKANAGNVPGTLMFDACPGTFHVIDGQHRLFGYTALDKSKGIRDSHRVIVTAFENLDIEEEAEIFLEVNQEAKPVAASLIMEIQYSTEKVSQINLCNGLVFALRDKKTSVLYKKINQAEETRKAPLQTKNFQSGLMSLKIINGKGFKSGIFWNVPKGKWPDMLVVQDNIYQHINDLLKIIKLNTTSDIWKKKNGLLQDIFFQGILDVIDRSTMEAFKNIDMEGESGRIQNTKKITGKTKKYIKSLSMGLAALSVEEKEKLFNMKAYGKGSTARNAVSAVLVDKFLAKKYPTLKYKSDDDYLRLFNSDTLQPNEVKKILKYTQHLETQLKKIESSGLSLRLKKTREDRGFYYHGLLKDLVHLIFQKEEHYDLDYWESLVMPGFYKEGNVWDQVITRWNKEKSEAGANAYKYPMNHVEGKLIRELLCFPQKHRSAKPKDNPKERVDSVLNFIWNNLLIFREGSELNEYKKMKNKADDSSTLWKKGTEYILLFAEFRNYSSAHKRIEGETGNPLKHQEELFDYYEKVFKKKIYNIASELNIENHLQELDD